MLVGAGFVCDAARRCVLSINVLVRVGQLTSYRPIVRCLNMCRPALYVGPLTERMRLKPKKGRCVMTERTWIATPVLILLSFMMRLTFQHSIETRFQILFFWIVASGYEAFCYSVDVPTSFRRLIINMLVTAVSISFVRWRLEGFSFLGI